MSPTSKTGCTFELGFEVLRDLLNWNVYTSYIPKSDFTSGIRTSVTDIGLEVKGRSVYSRYSSFFGAAGFLSRSELKNYPMYSISAGMEFAPDLFVYFSPGVIFKSSFRNYDFPEVVASKTFEVFFKIYLTI